MRRCTPRLRSTTRSWGGKVSLEHDLERAAKSPSLSVTRGYKAGGVNIDARINLGTDPLTYATEALWNYEAGLRGHWLGPAR